MLRKFFTSLAMAVGISMQFVVVAQASIADNSLPSPDHFTHIVPAERVRIVASGGHTAFAGVMAQEVLNVMPAAVSRGSDSYLRVSYDRLGLPFETHDRWVTTGAQLPIVK